MADVESHDRSPQRPDGQSEDSPRIEGASLFWWYVWIPVIVAITLWIGGWWFGNYGGPWGSKPQSVQPNISEPARATLNVNTGESTTVGHTSYLYNVAS